MSTVMTIVFGNASAFVEWYIGDIPNMEYAITFATSGIKMMRDTNGVMLLYNKETVVRAFSDSLAEMGRDQVGCWAEGADRDNLEEYVHAVSDEQVTAFWNHVSLHGIESFTEIVAVVADGQDGILEYHVERGENEHTCER